MLVYDAIVSRTVIINVNTYHGYEYSHTFVSVNGARSDMTRRGEFVNSVIHFVGRITIFVTV